MGISVPEQRGGGYWSSLQTSLFAFKLTSLTPACPPFPAQFQRLLCARRYLPHSRFRIFNPKHARGYKDDAVAIELTDVGNRTTVYGWVQNCHYRVDQTAEVAQRLLSKNCNEHPFYVTAPSLSQLDQVHLIDGTLAALPREGPVPLVCRSILHRYKILQARAHRRCYVNAPKPVKFAPSQHHMCMA